MVGLPLGVALGDEVTLRIVIFGQCGSEALVFCVELKNRGEVAVGIAVEQETSAPVALNAGELPLGVVVKIQGVALCVVPFAVAVLIAGYVGFVADLAEAVVVASVVSEDFTRLYESGLTYCLLLI